MEKTANQPKKEVCPQIEFLLRIFVLRVDKNNI